MQRHRCFWIEGRGIRMIFGIINNANNGEVNGDEDGEVNGDEDGPYASIDGICFD